MTLHLLRGRPPNINGNPVTFEEFISLVRGWKAEHPDILFGSWTRRTPRRTEELKGGSVYFVDAREIRFRMPLERVESVQDFQPSVPVEPKFANHISLTCRCEIIMVEPRPVRYMRGWRYLEEKDAPRDLPGEGEGLTGDAPPAMQRELREMGLL